LVVETGIPGENLTPPFKYSIDMKIIPIRSTKIPIHIGAVVWWLDLQLPMQSMPINTDVASSNPAQGEVYNII
jgi:hypothetical protein